MPRRIKTKSKEKDWRWYASFVLNGAVALSMVLGTVFVFAGAPTTPAATPTSTVAPTVIPTAAPANSAPEATPTPKASVQGPDSLPYQVVYLVAEPATLRAL